MAKPERTDAMRKLLALGPLPYLDLIQTMGGDLVQAGRAYAWLEGRGQIRTLGTGPTRLVVLEGAQP